MDYGNIWIDECIKKVENVYSAGKFTEMCWKLWKKTFRPLY